MKLTKFSNHLFWDVNRDQLDLEKDKSFIIHRVLTYGLWQDWLLIRDYFGVDDIAQTAMKFKELDSKSLAFISAVSETDVHKFRCYITKQSVPKHWNF
ncbi:hypothetical protein EFY79_12835 [Hanamia caeni]|uniref:DUF6922 domain-containing protein n=1 Tax=Hanamia caeni TaxID=2294116 RepID=A0A3M9NDM2_9BACT|nr:hypothetical protein [Hanamia caeni]RNI35407.1 hypothetical protein EFY79_12835 [Hanamia caeni]